MTSNAATLTVNAAPCDSFDAPLTGQPTALPVRRQRSRVRLRHSPLNYQWLNMGELSSAVL